MAPTMGFAPGVTLGVMHDRAFCVRLAIYHGGVWLVTQENISHPVLPVPWTNVVTTASIGRLWTWSAGREQDAVIVARAAAARDGWRFHGVSA